EAASSLEPWSIFFPLIDTCDPIFNICITPSVQSFLYTMSWLPIHFLFIAWFNFYCFSFSHPLPRFLMTVLCHIFTPFWWPDDFPFTIFDIIKLKCQSFLFEFFN